jgi:hypothetical protein
MIMSIRSLIRYPLSCFFFHGLGSIVSFPVKLVNHNHATPDEGLPNHSPTHPIQTDNPSGAK